jgi:hypothetical protein
MLGARLNVTYCYYDSDACQNRMLWQLYHLVFLSIDPSICPSVHSLHTSGKSLLRPCVSF